MDANTDPHRAPPARLRWTALGGALAVIVMTGAGVFPTVAEALVALGLACVVPLGASLASAPHADGTHPPAYVWASWAVPAAVPFGLGSFVLPPSPSAGALAGVWLIATVVLACSAIGRVALRGPPPLAELAVDLGHLYLPVGAAWLCASRGAMSPMGFHEPVVLFTAAHFHYAGFAAPLVLGLLGRELQLRGGLRRVYLASALVVCAGVPLVAIGITVSRALERPAALLLGAGMLAAAALLALAGARRIALRTNVMRASGALLTAAGLSLVLSMGFAVAFALTGSAGRAAPGGRIAFSTMAAVHGAANALGFACCALLAFALAPPPRRRAPFALSRPRLLGRGFVGPDFFDRVGAIDPARAVQGQLSSLDVFAHEGFDPARVDPKVRDFYERTADYALLARPQWHPPFARPAGVFQSVARRALGNLELPLRDEGDEVVRTRLFALDPARDGREDPRGYVRTWGDGAAARANYVAAYAVHRGARCAYLSCAFPLPGSALLGVLRFEQGARGGGLSLTSERDDDDAGMFLATPLGVTRVPISERIDVWTEGDALRAEHRVKVLGVACVTLRYELRATPRPPR